MILEKTEITRPNLSFQDGVIILLLVGQMASIQRDKVVGS